MNSEIGYGFSYHTEKEKDCKLNYSKQLGTF